MRKISYAKIPNTVAYNSNIDLEARMLTNERSCRTQNSYKGLQNLTSNIYV